MREAFFSRIPRPRAALPPPAPRDARPPSSGRPNDLLPHRPVEEQAESHMVVLDTDGP